MPKLAIAQISCSPDMQANLNKADQFIHDAAKAGAHLICFPEVQLSPFFPKHKGGDASRYAITQDGPEISQLCQSAKNANIVVVANIYLQDKDNKRYDASPVIETDGTLLGITRMNEIAQFDGFWEQDYYAPGQNLPVYETSAGRLGVVICFDRHFPETYRQTALKGAQIIATPTCCETGEPNDLFEAEMRTLAFHNSLYAMLANRCGHEEERSYAGQSLILDPAGTVIARAQSAETLLLAEYDLEHREKLAAQRGFLSARTARQTRY